VRRQLPAFATKWRLWQKNKKRGALKIILIVKGHFYPPEETADQKTTLNDFK